MMTPGHAGQITTVAIICCVIAGAFFYFGLLALADAEEREHRDQEGDEREKVIIDTPLHWPPVDEHEQWIG